MKKRGRSTLGGEGPRGTCASRNTQPVGLRFRATLGGEPKIELTLV